jgi:hypothetical protein
MALPIQVVCLALQISFYPTIFNVSNHVAIIIILTQPQIHVFLVTHIASPVQDLPIKIV